ncbi:hypothetical protein FRC07_001307 [Ceratobasidium sp. 392]|nr:hypothetical protein FRC07_001307 [Ceratobasidium sp. 392]
MKTDSKSLFLHLSNDLQAAALEFVGTAFWLLLALGGIEAANYSSQGGDVSILQLLYISTSMGLSLLVSVWLFFRVTGGVFNPAISTALLLVGAIGPVRWVLFCIAQMAGAVAASALLLALLPGTLTIPPTPAKGVNSAQAVFIEAFLTAALVFSVLILAAEKQPSTPFAPICIGLTLFAGHLWGVIYTGAAMNTARAFGPAVVSGFNKDHWVYWVGPFIGSLAAASLYSFLKNIEYWRLNPNQDTSDPNYSPESPMRTISSNDPLR